MKTRRILTILILALGLTVWPGQVSEAEPMGTTFTYQGRLIDANEAADGEYDFEFTLYDANTDGNQVGWAASIADVDVVDGYFTVELFLGSASFDGDARWLEIGVRPGEFEDPSVYTILEPRQEVTPTPYAIYARMAGADNDWMVSDSNMYSIPSGNVGIGTTTPEEKLTVVDGTIKCTNNIDAGWAVHGEASGWYGQGVYGYGTGYGGRGVYGKAGEDLGMGVYGKATAEGQVSNWGGYFSAAGDFGTGVFGTATATGDVQNYGGFFRAAGSSGRAVHGEATDAGDVTNYGGYFKAAGLEGRAVYGEATHTGDAYNPVANYGGYFLAQSLWGQGVCGETTGMMGAGVYGLATGEGGFAVWGRHRTSGNYGYLGGGGRGVYAYSDSGTGVYGDTDSGYAGYFDGDVHVAGTLSATSKPFIQPHKSDPSKEVVYASLEGPEHAVFIRGKGGCQNGVAIIKMPEYWQQVAAEQDITVNLTPMGAWAGLYVQSASNREVVVRVAQGGAENARFCYYITAPRAGFEEHQPIQENTHFTADGTSAGDFESRYTEDTVDNKAIRAMLKSNGILTADGKLNMDTVGRLGWTVNADNAEPIQPKPRQFAHAGGVKH